jgi:hypothetical protein
MLGEMADISPATADGADEDLLAALFAPRLHPNRNREVARIGWIFANAFSE